MSRPMRFAGAYSIPGPGIVARLHLPQRMRFVAFMHDEAPVVVPIDEPGTYDIDVAALKDTMKWPVVIVVVSERHALLFAKLTKAQAADIIAQASRVVRQGMQ